MNLEQLTTIVESSIQSFGIDPITSRGQKEGQWDLKKGAAQVWIDIWTFDHKEGDKHHYVQVLSPVLNLDLVGNQCGLYQECLTINQSLYGVAFSIMKNWLYLRVIREAEGLDISEMAAMLNRVGDYSDVEGKQMVDKYTVKDPPTGGWEGGSKA